MQYQILKFYQSIQNPVLSFFANLLSFFGEEKRHHPIAVVSVGRRSEKYIHRLALSDFNYASRCVVARVVAVLLVALVNEHC